MLKTKEELVSLAGSAAKLARLLGVSRAAVAQWTNVPPYRILQLKQLKPEWFVGTCKEEETDA